MNSILVEPEAEQEIRAARDWYEARQVGLGADFMQAVDDAFARILELPKACSVVPGVSRELDVRRAFLKRFPYAAAYVEHGEVISVVALSHHRRRPGYWLARVEKG